MKDRRTRSRRSYTKIGSFRNVDFITISQGLLVADLASVSRAARELGVVQSSVSRRIQALENELGVSLFERHQGGVRLTMAGRKFFEMTRAALSEIETAIENAAAAGAGILGTIRIGLCSGPLPPFLMELLKEFRRERAAVRLEIFENSARTLITRILDRTLDMAFIDQSVSAPDCDTQLLWRSRIFVALPNDHILAIGKDADWGYLREQRFIFSRGANSESLANLVRERFAEVDRRPELETYAVCQETLLRLVALGFGVTLTPDPGDERHYPGVTFRRLRDEGECLAFSAVWLPENDNPALRRLVSLARLMTAERPPAPAPTLPR